MLLSAAVLAVLVAFGVSVNLGFAVPLLEATVSRLAVREVTIGGPVRLKPGLQPALEIHHVRIAEPDGWEPGPSPGPGNPGLPRPADPD